MAVCRFLFGNRAAQSVTSVRGLDVDQIAFYKVYGGMVNINYVSGDSAA